MKNLNRLVNISKQADKILRDELVKECIKYNIANVRVYDVKTVGVQGDERTYSYPIEIELKQKGKFVWDIKFLEKLSSRITNEVKKVNRIVYVISSKRTL
jgi:GMP synthase (glutamine-hydrolysing)